VTAILNTTTGEVVYVTDEELQAAEEDEPFEEFPEWQRDAIRIAGEILETDHYLPLPTKFDIHEYSIMARFCRSVDTDDMREDLCNAIRGRGAFRVESKELVHFAMLRQPAMLGFEAKDAALVHHKKEHDQGLMRIDNRMSATRMGCAMLPKTFKQVKQQVDIVGEGRFDHSGTSRKVFLVFSRRKLPLPAMSVN
jgi:hypothetical protein